MGLPRQLHHHVWSEEAWFLLRRHLLLDAARRIEHIVSEVKSSHGEISDSVLGI